jgi:hypothetical protein
MRNLGCILKWGIILIFLSWSPYFRSLAIAQFYYLNSYDGPPDQEVIHVKSIDLSLKTVLSDITFTGLGVILDKNPVVLDLNNRKYLISFSENGGFNKNSDMGLPHYVTYYSILRSQNGNLTIIHEDSLIGEQIHYLEQFPGEQGFRFAITTDSTSDFILLHGLYSLNQGMRFRLIRQIPLLDEPGYLGEIGGFEFLSKVPYSDQFHLYWSFHSMQYWLVKLNNSNNAVIDSLQLRHSKGESIPFAFHPGTNKFYSFYVNWEMHTSMIEKTRQDEYINPEVHIYDPGDLHLIQNIPIADYPDSLYPGQEYGLADVVGDYIVYYFFQQDDVVNFAPAMLFIFDTRTNEATWLRVGWR